MKEGIYWTPPLSFSMQKEMKEETRVSGPFSAYINLTNDEVDLAELLLHSCRRPCGQGRR